MSIKTIIGGVAVLAMAWPVASAQAQDSPDFLSVNGASFSIGGGVVGFTDGTTRDFTSVGGAWDARLTYGTRSPVAIEAAYTGGAMAIDALGLDSNAALLSTGAEVLGRVNIMTTDIQPYVVAGVGWRRYSIINSDRNTSSVSEDDNLGEIPMGAGLAYRYQSFVVDGRALIRFAFNDDLIAPTESGDTANLNNWQAQLTLGYEF